MQDEKAYKVYQQQHSEDYHATPEFLSMFSFIVGIFIFARTLLLLRIFPQYGQIVRLLHGVIYEAASFTFFWSTVIFCFAFGYLVLGNTPGGHDVPDHDSDDYKRLNQYLSYVLYSYRTAVGDLENPNAEVWSIINKND